MFWRLMKKKNFWLRAGWVWGPICRDLYQHRWMRGPAANTDRGKQPFSGSQEATLVMSSLHGPWHGSNNKATNNFQLRSHFNIKTVLLLGMGFPLKKIRPSWYHCCRSHCWDSNPRRCDCLSQPSSTQPATPQENSGSEADRFWPGACHIIPPFFYISEWSLSTSALHHCPAWPPILARFDPHTSCLVRLGPQSWSALAHAAAIVWISRLALNPPRH